MKRIELKEKMTEAEYFLFEEKSELKHELIEGNLYEMSGVSIYHNNIVLRLSMLLYALLKQSPFQLTLENFKVKTPDGNFFYPDIAVCEPDVSKYYSAKPVLIIEVLSESTRQFDLADKFIQYRKIDTLHYYLCVEPEQQVVIFYYKHDNGEWVTETFTKDEQVIAFPKLNASFTIKDIYNA
jgi:Uma2 family endonuclease